MSGERDDLIAAKARFHTYRCGMRAAFDGACRNSPTALDALAILRGSLPAGFQDFREFESSRSYSRKQAYQSFDRAISKAEGGAS